MSFSAAEGVLQNGGSWTSLPTKSLCVSTILVQSGTSLSGHACCSEAAPEGREGRLVLCTQLCLIPLTSLNPRPPWPWRGVFMTYSMYVKLYRCIIWRNLTSGEMLLIHAGKGLQELPRCQSLWRCPFTALCNTWGSSPRYKVFWKISKSLKLEIIKYGFLKEATHFTGSATHVWLKHSGNILIFWSAWHKPHIFVLPCIFHNAILYV